MGDVGESAIKTSLARAGKVSGLVAQHAVAPSLYRYIWSHSGSEQVRVVLLTLLSFPFVYAVLDLPKHIVNKAISGQATGEGMYRYLPAEQISHLFALCAIYFGLTVFNNFFKLVISRRTSRLGELVVTTLRGELYGRLLRLPPERMLSASPGQFVAMITAEAEALAGFIGDAVALPVLQAGTLLVYLAFIFVQEPILGLGTIALYPVQAWLIPKLQAKINSFSRERIRLMRDVADQVGNSVSSFAEIRSQQSAAFQIDAMNALLLKVRAIRFEIFDRKYRLKYLNNILNKVVPLLFYSWGGYLAIKGQLSIGALVAVLAAYSDMGAPWKELLDFYQQKEDMTIRYQQVIQEFFVESNAPKPATRTYPV